METALLLRSALARLFELFAGGKGLFLPHGTLAARPPQRAVVLAPGGIPTTDLYLRGRLEHRFRGAVRYVDTLNVSPDELTPGDDALIVVVRHTPRRWLRWLERRQAELAGVAFLMDDDLPAAARAPELPFRYALKTAWRYALGRRSLSRLCTEVWVSTPELAERYAGSSPKVLEPGYVGPTLPEEGRGVYFYHGSWAHRKEIEWLVSVVRQVQETLPGVWFEIMGTDRVRHMFRGIPRVRVVHPMPWPDYLAYAGSVRYQVGLAPCFDTAFNRARSCNKVFDITRLGAAGIYSNVPPFAEKVVHGHTGLLCANDPKTWAETIVLLLKDQGLRAGIYNQALDWCEQTSACSLELTADS